MNTRQTLATGALLCGLFSTSALAAGIQASLSLEQNYFSGDQDIFVTVTLTNEEKVPVKVLKWYTAADDVEESLFKVSVNSEHREYLGAHYKRPAPSKKDYINLKAGESVSYRVELSALYDMSQTGDYQVSFDVASAQLFTPNPGQEKKMARLGVDGIHSKTVNFYVEGREFKSSVQGAKPDSGTTENGITYTGRCSNTQKSSIQSGLNAAKSMAADAKNYLVNYNSSSRDQSVRYNTWFGSYTSSRWNSVTGNFSNIDSALNTQSLTFDCSCKKSYFAYVYPTQPYKIYLCNAFWSAPTSGTDSKGGTIVHETSHFNIVAGTDDIVYGQSGAKSLAQSNPAQAIQNADSHEYFAENTPKQN